MINLINLGIKFVSFPVGRMLPKKIVLQGIAYLLTFLLKRYINNTSEYRRVCDLLIYIGQSARDQHITFFEANSIDERIRNL